MSGREERERVSKREEEGGKGRRASNLRKGGETQQST